MLQAGLPRTSREVVRNSRASGTVQECTNLAATRLIFLCSGKDQGSYLCAPYTRWKVPKFPCNGTYRRTTYTCERPAERNDHGRDKRLPCTSHVRESHDTCRLSPSGCVREETRLLITQIFLVHSLSCRDTRDSPILPSSPQKKLPTPKKSLAATAGRKKENGKKLRRVKLLLSHGEASSQAYCRTKLAAYDPRFPGIRVIFHDALPISLLFSPHFTHFSSHPLFPSPRKLGAYGYTRLYLSFLLFFF